jgi:phycobilisome rod-core linker protein
MTIPLLDYSTTSRNHRVAAIEVPGDENSRRFVANGLLSSSEVDALIHAAYRQVFHEQQMLADHRQQNLESQLKTGKITVRDFVKGLATSDSFRRLNFEVNNNYYFAQLCIQRILGRDIYNQREALAWSTAIATEGVESFINALVDSEEYLANFGENVVPYHRRRILPQHSQGDLPFMRMARYGDNHLTELRQLGNDFSASRTFSFPSRYRGLPPETLRLIGAAITFGFGGFFSLILLGVILSWFGLISL